MPGYFAPFLCYRKALIVIANEFATLEHKTHTHTQNGSQILNELEYVSIELNLSRSRLQNGWMNNVKEEENSVVLLK